MFLRRAVQVSTVLIYWFVLVPVVAKYLTDAKWMRKTKWTRKKIGFYGIAAFAFIFVYFVAMYAYVWCKRWERAILAQEKRDKEQTGKINSTFTASTTDLEAASNEAAPLTRTAALGALVRIRPSQPPPLPPTTAAVHKADNRGKPTKLEKDTAELAGTSTRSKLKIVRAAPRLPGIHRTLPLVSAPAPLAPDKVTASSPLVEDHPLANELERRQKSGNRAERLTAELADILRRYYRISTGSVQQPKAPVEKV